MTAILNAGRSGPRPPGPAEPRRAVPVKWWAGIGAGSLALTVYVWGAWLLSGNAYRRTPAEPVPDWQLLVARSLEVAMPAATVVVVYRLVIVPWRRERQLTTDGRFVIAFLLLYLLQDPWLNYGANLFWFNPVFFNLGCPQCHVPGFQGSKDLAEPLLMIWGMYVPVLFGLCVVANRLMAGARRRWPDLGGFGTAMVAVAFFVAIDLAIEVPYLRLGLMSYPGAIPELSIFGGHSYQYPIYELKWAVTWAGFACVRYFVDDRGRTVAERGIDRIAASSRVKGALQLLALLGILQTIFLLYGLAMVPWAIQNPWFP